MIQGVTRSSEVYNGLHDDYKGLQRFARDYSKSQGVTTVLPQTSVRTNLDPPLHVSRGHILHFKHPCVLAVNRMANLTFREKKMTKPSSSFFRLNLGQNGKFIIEAQPSLRKEIL